MYKIKQIPEDFIVEEISDYQLDSKGEYAYFILKKTKLNTINAVERLAKELKIHSKNIGFAGNKDKNAVTKQLISIKNGKKEFEKRSIENIELVYVGNGTEQLFLGKLKGNKFQITIRNVEKEDIEKIHQKKKNQSIQIPNFYGQQRFSRSNHLIGKAILKNNLKEAIELSIRSNSNNVHEIKDHLKNHPNDFITALKKIPLTMLKFYIHAYQSFLFNKAVEEIAKQNIECEEIPVVGFGTTYENKEIENIIRKILKEETISEPDFIYRPIPELSMEGDIRKAFLDIKDFQLKQESDDELNENKKKVIITFSLPKGSYATTVIDCIMKQVQFELN